MKFSKFLSVLLAMAMVLSCLSLTVTAEATAFSGGSGTEADPYLIASFDDFLAIASYNGGDNSGVYYKQTAELTLQGYTPFSFNGNYNGGNNIVNIQLSGAHYLGLFKELTGNVSVADITVKGKISAWTGGGSIAYSIANGSTVTLKNIINDADISGTAQIAGIIGIAQLGSGSVTFENVVNNGSITSSNGTVGGLVSRADFATFINCRNNGAVKTTKAAGEEIYAGGLVGRGRSYFQKCINTGIITAIEAKGDYAIGGILGGNVASITFDDCMNTGELITDGNAGGIIGSCGYNASGPALRRCYTTVGTPVGVVVSGGGIYGANTYYLSDSEIDSIETITTALTAEQMEDISNFKNFSSDVWEMKPETGYFYPQLKNNYVYVEWGTEENPYIIDSAEDFIAIGKLSSTAGKYFKQTASFDLSGYTPFNFEGIYDGGNNTINLTLNGAHYLALFNALSGSASISDLTIDGSVSAWSAAAALSYDVLKGSDVTVTNVINNANISSNNFAAGIIMYSNVDTSGKLTITNCRNNGNITNHATNSKTSGGIVGKGKANISKSVNTGTITGGTISGADGIGGIIGANHTSATIVSDCLNVGIINATGNVGGIIGIAGLGSSGPNMSKSYTTEGIPVGAIYAGGRVEGSALYYLSDSEIDDIDTTTALSETQMQSLECFSGFSSDNWEMKSETGYFYPQLKNNYVYVEWGTEENPYIIDSAEDFIAIGTLPSTTGKYFKQTASFDLSGYTPFNFEGYYDGGNNAINLTLSGNHYLSLFNTLLGTVKISDLTINGKLDAWSDAASIALLVAANANVTLENITNNAEVRSDNNVAGIISKSEGSATLIITECINNGNIYSEATGKAKYNGGILGYGKAIITNSYNTGTISSACDATGNEAGAGGIVGVLRTSSAKIENCFNAGEIKAKGNAGGILGLAGGGSSTSVVKTSYTLSGIPVGGIHSSGALTASNLYYLADSELDAENGTTALSDEQMKVLASFGGFSSDVWTLDSSTGYDYPQIKGMFIEYEQGTEKNPYPITDEASFVAMADKLNDGVYFELLNNIDLTSDYVPFALTNGNINGNGFTVNMKIEKDSDFAGLFTKISGKAAVTNLKLDGTVSGTNYVGALAGMISSAEKVVIKNIENNARITATGARVGGIIGDMYSDSSVGNSTVEFTAIVNNGSVSGDGYWVGGVVGLNKGGMTLSGLINNGSVYGGNSAGGIVGCAYGHVENCYNTGSINGPTAGGIVGYTMNSADITSCFNTGSVTKVITEETIGTEAASGILGSAGANGTTVKDCYDAGYLALAENAIIGRIDTENEITAEIINCYYLNPVKTAGREGTTPVTPAELKVLEISDAFVVTEGVYPQLKGLNTLTSVDELYVVTVNCGDNGILNVGTSYAKAGKPLTVHAFPEEGYQISAITVDGEAKAFENNSYTIEAVNSDTAISVSFEKLILNAANIVNTIGGEELVESDYVIYNIGRKYINYYSELVLIEVTGSVKEAGINLYDGETLVAKIPAALTTGNFAGVFIASQNEGLYTAKPYVTDSEDNETEGESVTFILSKAE